MTWRRRLPERDARTGSPSCRPWLRGSPPAGGLTAGAPFSPGGSTAWVGPARDDAGTDFALKVGWPHPEAEREADGLRTRDGAGAVRLCQVSELAAAGASPGSV